ncbi:hypothetical protein M3Y98_00056100 [Aphelenchoides besseyi]|nr:hypothetical protein M3Y98_00056100 [Aphelenchoides besseyi]
MRTWSIYFFFCVLACCAILLSESTKKFKGKRSRAAKTPASTGPCNPDNTCANPKHVCQTSDGNCYPKNTPGLNDHDDCKDVHPPRRRSQCPGIRYLCNNTIYYTLMTSQCPHTCKRCSTKRRDKQIKNIADQIKNAKKRSNKTRAKRRRP